MNTTDNPQHIDPARPDPARLMPEEPRERPELVEATSTPEAVRPVLNRPANTMRMPSQTLDAPSSGFEKPTAAMMTLPTTRPMRIDSRDAKIFLVMSFS